MTSKERKWAEAERALVRRLLPSCALCGEHTHADHVYLQLATAVARGGESDASLLDQARRGEWIALRRATTWNHEKDNLEWFAVRCSGGTQILTVMSPFELFADDQLLLARPAANASELEAIELWSNEWKPL